MNVFISGISGFIGKALATDLAGRGFTVAGMGTDESLAIPGVSYVRGDVCDRAAVKKYSHGSDVFIHLASIVGYSEIAKDPKHMFDVNWEGTRSMLDAFVENNGSHFIFFSTSAVYGAAPGMPRREDMIPRPTTYMGRSKYMCEQMLDFFSGIHPEKQFSILRPFNVYGPGQKESFLVPLLARQIAEGKEEVSLDLARIRAKRDYVYVDDVVSAVLAVINNRSDHGTDIFNVGTGRAHSAEDIIRIFSSLAGKEIKIAGTAAEYRPDEQDEEYCSCEPLRRLGWTPEVDIREGIARVLNWYKKRSSEDSKVKSA